MKIKKGVSISGIRPETVLGILIVNSVYEKHGVELVLTSVMEGKHKTYSLHYSGCAGDTRTRDFPPEAIPAVLKDLRESLGDEFEVFFEKSHFHIEWQPIAGVNL